MQAATQSKREAYGAAGTEKADRLFAEAERLVREAASKDAEGKAILRRVARFETDGEFDASHYSAGARMKRARTSIITKFPKANKCKEWHVMYEQVYVVLRAITREWRRHGSPADGILIKGPRLRKITGLSERWIRELVTLLRGCDLVKNEEQYPAPFADDGRPFLAVVPGVGRLASRFTPHLP